MTSIRKKQLLRLFRFAWPERKLLLFGTLFLVLGSLVLLTFPQAVRITLDDAVEAGNTSLINTMGVAMLILLALQSVAAALRYYLFTLAGERMVKRIRSQLFATMLQQEIAFFDTRKTGDLMSRINSDATMLQNSLSVNISMMLRNFAAAFGGLVLLFVTSWQLAIFMLVALPPLALLAARFGRRVRKISHEVQNRLGDASGVADETLGNIRTVISFGAEDVETSRFEQALDRALRTVKGKIRVVARFTGTISLLGSLVIVVILWLGGHMVIEGELSIGTLSAFILYTMTVAISVSTLGGLWTDLMNAAGAATRIFEVIDRQNNSPASAGIQPDSLRGTIEFRNIFFSYPTRGEFPVFSGLDLTIGEGESVALVGSSGSGKSTVAALLLRLYEPQSGEIVCNGINIAEMSARWLRRQIGTVSQEPVLMSTSIRDNIAYGRPDASFEEVKKAAESAYAHHFIEAFPERYETLVGERGVQLSGGQRQRIAIARAMLKDPAMLILDEATSALDAESEDLVQEALTNLMRGRTVLVIAHRLSTVSGCDRVVVLEKGEIVQQGRHEDLIADKNGTYFSLVEKQLRTG